MRGNQRAALAANEHKPVKGADQDEALQLAFWRLHEGRKAWKDTHPTRPALVPGTLEFRKSILEKVFSEKELQAGQHTFMMMHGDNITMLDEIDRVQNGPPWGLETTVPQVWTPKSAGTPEV